jgi:hypothetical protein
LEESHSTLMQMACGMRSVRLVSFTGVFADS